MMRLFILGLGITCFLLFALASCGDEDDGGAIDGGTDTDTDSDTDTGVQIEYPEALNPLLDPNSLMTGPISPPPEDVFGDGMTGDGPPGPDPTLDDHLVVEGLDDEDEDWDGGDPDEEL
ncbi:MAG: hypothetical protein JRF63_00920 [Deltaproteobacteria bacterium]|nr:hypothetical protein [Deltaproteobacteria bacterium]